MKYTRYGVVYNRDGPLVLVRFPESKTTWRAVRLAINRIMREELGILAKHIYQVEMFMSDVDDLFIARLNLAFAGDTTILPIAHLFAWDDATNQFTVVRKGKE